MRSKKSSDEQTRLLTNKMIAGATAFSESNGIGMAPEGRSSKNERLVRITSGPGGFYSPAEGLGRALAASLDPALAPSKGRSFAEMSEEERAAIIVQTKPPVCSVVLGRCQSCGVQPMRKPDGSFYERCARCNEQYRKQLAMRAARKWRASRIAARIAKKEQAK